MPKTIPPGKSRQGSRGDRVLVILLVGLVLAFVIWGGVEIWGEAIDTGSVEQPGAVTTQGNEQPPANPN
ncbi:hypothetical protein ACG873_21375 [Mesorhizobium sp. AaZ16]|uniref:hypothetical protein n=1 Tax=Mesorhizobium sp. AaZ16 TaxID=3402289 RepID=UPI00374F8CCE